MTPTFWAFVLRRVATSLWRRRWNHVLTALTMAMTLFVVGAFTLLQVNFKHLLSGWGEQIQLTAYLKQTLSVSEIAEAAARVKSWPEVERVRLINQEQAWRDFHTALGAQSGLLDGLPRDVLPASLEIALAPGYRDSPKVEQLAVRLRAEAEFSSVEYPQEWIERLALILLALEWAKWCLGGLLFLATFFIVGSAVKLALTARRDEIEIMQLVGASMELIQAPFMIEGMIHGIVGSALSLAMLWGLFMLAQSEFSSFAAFMAPLVRPQFLDGPSVAFILTSGLLLGAAANLFSLRRFIKTWKAAGHAV